MGESNNTTMLITHVILYLLTVSCPLMGGVRLKRQICFGGRCGPVQSETSSKPTVSHGRRQSINFAGSGGPEVGKKTFSLKQFLSKEAPPTITKRFNFGPTRARRGQQCTTPIGEAGSCQYITSSQCSSVLEDILEKGIDNKLLSYLLQAIKRPCGFERFDFTLCCADQSSTSSTTSTTTTTTTTTTTSTTTSTTTTTATTTTTTSTTTTTTGDTTTTAEVETKVCGVSKYKTPRRRAAAWTQKIVGGVYAKQGAWPWAVIIGRVLDTAGRFQVICGGTLVDRDTVLSAAHCFDQVAGLASANVVRLGEHNITVGAQDGALGVVDIEISSVTQHPSWNSLTLSHDIAVVKLAKNVTYSQDISPACLPDEYSGLDLPSLVTERNPAIIVGWGATQTGGRPETTLKQTSVAILQQDSCKQTYSEVGVDISSKQLCAGSQGRDTCSGDSGGSLLSNRVGGKYAVVGITSFGVECARPDFPGVYTRVDQYLPWVRSKM